jgi:simple sugar transport system permease protein
MSKTYGARFAAMRPGRERAGPERSETERKTDVSDTAERTADVAGPPPRNQGAGNEILGALRTGAAAFLRQREATVLVVVVALVIYFRVASSNFFSHANLDTLSSGVAAPYIILSIGEVLLLICGEIDLSVGFTFTLAPFIMYFLNVYYGFPVILAIIAALIFGLIVGFINAFLTVALRLPSFIATLGTSFILYGLVLTTSHAEPVTPTPAMQSIGKFFGNETASAWGWSAIIWAVVLVAIFHVVLTQTRWGLHTVAVGGNLLGAREAGISVARIKYGNFMITGLLGALVGIQVAFYDNTIDPSAGGYNYMFYAVAAAVLGGTAMLGGAGTIIGGFLGAFLLSILTDGFQITGVSANPLFIIFGAAVLIAMIANVQLTRLREMGRIK